VRPLFRDLVRTTFGRQAALDLFAAHGKAYHPVCQRMVGVDIEREGAKAAVDPATLARVGFHAAAPASGTATAVSSEGRCRAGVGAALPAMRR
jgi:hypothetical protein